VAQSQPQAAQDVAALQPAARWQPLSAAQLERQPASPRLEQSLTVAPGLKRLEQQPQAQQERVWVAPAEAQPQVSPRLLAEQPAALGALPRPLSFA
jgi:hypothetical protein